MALGSFANGNSMNGGNSHANGPLRLVPSPSDGGWTTPEETHWNLTTEPKLAGLT
jgi:hypothetical protein